MQRRDVLSPGFLYFVMLTLFLYAPIVVLVVFSFNDSRTLVFPLRGFTLRWYGELAGARELLAAVVNSVVLGLMSSVVATGLGTAAAIGIARHNFPGRRFFLAVSAMPMVIPYVVLGVALLILFSWWGVPLSLWTVGVAHVVINVPYAMLIVASRLAGFDKNKFCGTGVMDMMVSASVLAVWKCEVSILNGGEIVGNCRIGVGEACLTAELGSSNS